MKAFIIVSLTAVLALVIGVPARAMSPEEAAWQRVVDAAKREGVVNFSASTFVGKTGVEISKAFKDKYSISIELISGKSSARAEKVRMEQTSKSYVTDAFDASSSHPATLKKGGFFVSVAETLPALKEKDKFLRSPIEDSPEAQILAVLRSATTLWVNTNLVKPAEEPKSYYDLLDPKWKGKIYLNNPLYGSTSDELLAVLVISKALNEDYFVKLYRTAELSGVGGAKEIVDKLVRGEVAIGGPIGADDGMRAYAEGAPIKPLDLKEGTMYRGVTWSAVKNGPHPNATKVLINWLLSKDGQIAATKAVLIDGVRNDIPSAMPFRFTGPAVTETFELLLSSDARYSKQYFANLLGIKN